MSWIAFFAKLTQPKYRLIAANSKIPVFLTISFSHYVEFARWSLQLMNKSYNEHSFAPMQHILPLLATRLDEKEANKRLPPTSVAHNGIKADEKVIKNKSSMTSTPQFVLCDGSILQNSWEIASWADLKPPDDDFKQTLDEKVGPLSRQLFYSFVLKKSNENVVEGMFLENNHWLWKLMWYLGLKSLVLSRMRKHFKVDDINAVNECREKLKEVIDEIGRDKIEGRKSTFITGNKITQSDIALASLLAPMLVPPEYALGKFDKWFKLLQSQDKELKQEISYWRSTMAGKYTLQLYSSHRTTVL